MSGGTNKTVLVCVTAQPECERLIRAGRELADKTGRSLEVLSVQPAELDPAERASDLECLYMLSKSVHAGVMIYYNDEPAIVAAAHIKRHGISHIVTGMPDGINTGFLDHIHLLAPDIPISMVAKDSTVYTISPAVRVKKAAMSR